MMPCMFYMI